MSVVRIRNWCLGCINDSAWWLGVIFAFPEELNSVPRTNVWSSQPVTPAAEDLKFCLLRAPAPVHAHIQEHTLSLT